MAQKEAVRNWQGKILGWVETDSRGNKILRDFYGNILGKYDKSCNVTRDFYGNKVGQGDILMTLLR